jgi:hypothetical protein
MQSLLPFRWLALVCVLGIAVGIREARRQKIDVYHDDERNYPEAMAQLYPGSAQVEYLVGRQTETLALAPANVQEMQQRPDLLEQLLTDSQKRLNEAREHYERALAAGLRSEENLQYNYAVTLMQLRADPSEIEKAIAKWQRDFPHSDRDLASTWLTIREAHRKQDQFLAQLRDEREMQKRREEVERMFRSRRRGASENTTPHP